MTPQLREFLFGAARAMIVALAFFYAGWHEGSGHVRAKWDAERSKMNGVAAIRVGDVLKAQQSLQQLIDEGRTDRVNAENRIGRLYGVAVDGLRKRPENRAPNGVPDAASVGAGCTGAGLARPDGEFLARYAADAARLQSALDQCRTGYGAAKARLDALEQSDTVR